MDVATTCNYYVGLRIKESPMHHSTIIYLKAVTEDVVRAVIDTITRRFEKNPFVGAVLVLGDEDMMGPDKDIRVRKLAFDLSSQSGKLIFDLSKALYEAYGNKIYPQNPHISANGTKQDEIIFTSESVIADQIFVERRGANPEVIHVVDAVLSTATRQHWLPPTLAELQSDETIGVLYGDYFRFSKEVAAAFDEAGIPYQEGRGDVERTDQRAVDIIRRATRRNASGSHIRVKIFPKPLIAFLKIKVVNAGDGEVRERVKVDWKKTFIATQRMVMDGRLSCADEIDQYMHRIITLAEKSYDDMVLQEEPYRPYAYDDMEE